MRIIKGTEKMKRDQFQDAHMALPRKGRPTFDSYTRQRYRDLQLIAAQMELAGLKLERIENGVGNHGKSK